VTAPGPFLNVEQAKAAAAAHHAAELADARAQSRAVAGQYAWTQADELEAATARLNQAVEAHQIAAVNLRLAASAAVAVLTRGRDIIVPR
jgi:hypothetical protein